MSPFRLDSMSRVILESLSRDIPIDEPALAARLGCSAQMVHDRLGRLRSDGILKGVRAQVERRALGITYELLVSAAPGPRTTRQAMQDLCANPMVTRAFTLASRLPITFTLAGDSITTLEAAAASLSREADLHQVQTALIVMTLLDDPLHTLHARAAATSDGRPMPAPTHVPGAPTGDLNVAPAAAPPGAKGRIITTSGTADPASPPGFHG